MTHWLIVGFSFILSCGLVYAVYIVLSSLLEVKVTPRMKMTMCDKHGAIPTSTLIEIMEGAKDPRGKPVLMCALCFNEKRTNAKAILNAMEKEHKERVQ